MLEPFADLSTPLLADACVRSGVPLRAAPPGVRAVVPGQRLAGPGRSIITVIYNGVRMTAAGRRFTRFRDRIGSGSDLRSLGPGWSVGGTARS
jgi:hypothetical protein